MEIPDPAPEIVITLPKRGKMRVTTVDEADALIAQAVKAKVMILAAKAAIDPADPGVPAHEEAAPVPVPPLCAQPAPDNSPGECARLDGHRLPHRNLAGYEWGEDEPHPVHHWDIGSGETLCHDQHEDQAENGIGTEIWLCAAQAGHGGPDHIAYGSDGEPVKTWPVQRSGRAAITYPPGVDPMGPDAYKYHNPGCECWDCRAYRSGETAGTAAP